MAKRISDISLADILPSSIAGDPQVRAMAAALDGELQALSVDTRDAMIYSRVDELPENVLNILAWAAHSDFWDDRLGIRAKRHHVKNSILMHMRKGTREAILNGLRMIGAEAEISAWHEYGGSPYHFRIDALITDDTTDALVEEEVTSLVREVIENTKSERDTLDSLRLGLLLEDWIYRVNDDIREAVNISPAYVLSDEVEWRGHLLYNGEARFGGEPRYNGAVIFGDGSDLSGKDRGAPAFTHDWDALSAIGTLLGGLSDSIPHALYRYGGITFEDGAVYGGSPPALDGGIDIRVLRTYRYGHHHRFEEDHKYRGTLIYNSGTPFEEGARRYGYASLS